MTERTCSICDCKKTVYARGWCSMHWKRWHVHGDPLIAARREQGTPIERLMNRVSPVPGPLSTDCWVSSYSTNRNGYAHNGVTLAHRISYEHFVGLVPAGMDLDHLCRVPACVNPAHLEAVTHRENVLRGMHSSAITYRTEVCRKGHSMRDAYMRTDGRRECRHCNLARQRARRTPY